MVIKEMIENLKIKPQMPCCFLDYYYELLEKEGLIKYNYYDFMTTAPINCDEELMRVDTADFDLCCALLTMLLREDHFSGYGCFDKRFNDGDVQRIIDRMIVLLQERDDKIRKRLAGRAAEYLMFMDD